jgi:dCMP deaminase
MKKRIDIISYYLNIAEEVASRSTCLKRKYGAVIVNNERIISTGYNGAPRGIENCIDCDKCTKEGCKRGTNYENCIAVHAEQNAIICNSRQDMLGASLFLVGLEANGSYVENPQPCCLCKRMMKNAGIKYVYIRKNKNTYLVQSVDYYKKDDLLGGY